MKVKYSIEQVIGNWQSDENNDEVSSGLTISLKDGKVSVEVMDNAPINDEV